MKPSTTPRRTAAVIAVIALAVITAAAWWLSRPGDTAASSSGLPAQSVQADAVEVTMTPLALDDSGAVFDIEFDTHSVELDLDVPASAQLQINGSIAAGASWDGQGPGGHHREGTLRFLTPVPTGADVELRISGLPTTAIGSWTAP
jgi:hypothetical protein